jgi:hypothetical protein
MGKMDILNVGSHMSGLPNAENLTDCGCNGTQVAKFNSIAYGCKLRACLEGLRLRLHEWLRPEPCQTVEIAPAPGVEPELEPLTAFKGEVEPRFGGFTWLQLEIYQRSYFAKRFLKRLNSTREATPPEEPEPEPFLEET